MEKLTIKVNVHAHLSWSIWYWHTKAVWDNMYFFKSRRWCRSVIVLSVVRMKCKEIWCLIYVLVFQLCTGWHMIRIKNFLHFLSLCVCACVCMYSCSESICWRHSCGDVRRKVEGLISGKSQHLCVCLCACVCVCALLLLTFLFSVISQARKRCLSLPVVPLYLLNYLSFCLFLLFTCFIINVTTVRCQSYRFYTQAKELQHS